LKRSVINYAVAVFAALACMLGLGVMAAGTAGAAVHPDTVSNGVDVTTNNGVAGYYSDGGGGAYHYLNFAVTTTSTSDNMVLGTDGVGGQLCNPSTGETVGAGLERTGINTYGLFYGFGTLHGDAGAVDSAHGTEADSNNCLGGILPQANVHELSLGSAIVTGDRVRVQLKLYTVKLDHRIRYRVALDATDESSTGDTFSHVMAIGTGNPWFGQAGVGDQRSLAGLGSPASTSNPLAEFSYIYAGNIPFGPAFGCDNSTTQVNSAANSNNDAGAEPNAYAQIDPDNSLSGGCGSPASFSVYEGNPIS
jgi:hypothetical protein